MTPWVRATSPPFRIEVGENDPFYQPGVVDDEVVSDGFWVMLPPLSRGLHTIAFGGLILFDANGDGIAELEVYEADLVYYLTVQ